MRFYVRVFDQIFVNVCVFYAYSIQTKRLYALQLNLIKTKRLYAYFVHVLDPCSGVGILSGGGQVAEIQENKGG